MPEQHDSSVDKEAAGVNLKAATIQTSVPATLPGSMMPIMQQDHSNLPGPGPGLGVGSGAGPGSSPGLLPGLRPGRLPGAGSGPSSGPLPGLASGSGPAPGLLPALRPARGSRLGGYNANGEGDRHGNMNHLQGFHAYPRPMPVPRGGFGQGGGDQEVPVKITNPDGTVWETMVAESKLLGILRQRLPRRNNPARRATERARPGRNAPAKKTACWEGMDVDDEDDDDHDMDLDRGASKVKQEKAEALDEIGSAMKTEKADGHGYIKREPPY